MGTVFRLPRKGAKPATARPDARQKPEDNEQVRKWGATLMEDGYTIVPNALIEHQRRLGLDAVDFGIVMLFAMHWWKADEPPFPGKRRLADCLGLDPRNIQRRLAALVEAKVLIRKRRTYSNGGTNTNAYELRPLIAKAEIYAKANKEKRAAERAEKGRGRGFRSTR